MNGNGPVELALRCYPSWWRERYADEVRVVAADLTAEGRSHFVVTLNLLRGALRARAGAHGLPKMYDLWSTRTRVSIAAATLPWLLMAPLLLIAMGTQSLHSSKGQVFWSGFSFLPRHLLIMGAPPTPAPPLTPVATVVGYAGLAIAVLALVTIIVIAGGWFGFTSAIRHSASHHRRRLWLLAWTPGIALLADLALVIAQNQMRPTSFHASDKGQIVGVGGNPTGLHVLSVVVPSVEITGWLLAIACVAVASRRAEIGLSDLRFGKSVSIVVAILFALLLVAYATWGAALLVQARQAAGGNFTTIVFPHQSLWPSMLVLLSVAVLISGFSAREAKRSLQVLDMADL